MSALPAIKRTVEPITDNVIQLHIVNGQSAKNKKGKNDNRQSNKVSGISSEVYPFVNEEEIKAMVDVFNKRISEAGNNNQRMIACRNKMLFLIGINVGLRASDLITLKWKFFINDDGTFKEFYSLQPKKTKKTGKYVKLFFNETVRKAITEYLDNYPMEDIDEYLFKSREGDSYITAISLGRIIKDTAKEAGIEKNICSHSLRKTFGFWAWHNAEDKNKALVILQKIFNHSDTATTAKYIGITNDEMSDVFNSLDLGLDYI